MLVRVKRSKKVEVGGGGENEFTEGPAVDGNDIGEPHRQVGQILGEDSLSFTA